MKKSNFTVILAVMLVFFISFCLIGCGGDGPNGDDNTDTQNPIEGNGTYPTDEDYIDPIGGNTRGGITRRTDNAIKILNENLAGNIFQLGDTWHYSEPVPEGYIYEPGFGVYRLLSADESTSYGFFGFPDTVDKTIMAGFSVKNAASPITLFGFGVGDDPNDLGAALKVAGFQQEALQEFLYANIFCQAYTADAVSVNIYFYEDNIIAEMGIGLDSTNLDNVIY
jgi:hypothetical protein